MGKGAPVVFRNKAGFKWVGGKRPVGWHKQRKHWPNTYRVSGLLGHKLVDSPIEKTKATGIGICVGGSIHDGNCTKRQVVKKIVHQIIAFKKDSEQSPL